MTYIRIKVEGMEKALNLLKQLPPELVSVKGGPVLKALRRGGAVLKAESLNRLEAAIFGKSTNHSTGLLRSSMVVSRGKKPYGSKGERVVVKFRKKIYKRAAKETVRTVKTMHLFEYGSVKQVARPVLSTAFRAKSFELLKYVPQELDKEIQKLLRKLR